MVANRTKTIEYAWYMDNIERNISSQMSKTATFISSNHNYSNTVRMDIMENTDRTFKSAYIVWGMRENAEAATNTISSCRVGIYRSGAAGTSPTYYSFNDKLLQTGENISLMLVSNVTPWFVSNFTGTSQTIGCMLQFTTSGAGVRKRISGSNAFAKAVITYDYNDAAQAIRTKTVKIPIASNKALLPITNFTTIDATEGIPALDTFLPENTKVYKDIFFEFFPNEAVSATSDYTLGLKLDSEAAWSSGRFERALNSDTTPCLIWKRPDMDTSTTHILKASIRSGVAIGGAAVSNRIDTFGGILNVTYTYDHTNSTSIINSIQMPAITEDYSVVSDTQRNVSHKKFEFYIEEPDPIAIKKSGYFLTFDTAGAASFYISSTLQKQTTYTVTAAEKICGFCDIIHSITSGNKTVFNRGKNSVSLHYYDNVSDRLYNLNGMLLLNYTSGKHADGDGVHNHTIYYIYSGSQKDTLQNYFYRRSSQILEDNYYLNSVGFITYNMSRAVTAGYYYILSGKNLPNEFLGAGYEEYAKGTSISDGECANVLNSINVSDKFRRYPKDTHNYHDFESSREYSYLTNSTVLNPSLISIYTYHSITNDITGTVSGYTGDGSGIHVDLFEYSSNAYLTSGITTAGGSYSIPWYDDVYKVYTSAYQDSTHVGRSDIGT